MHVVSVEKNQSDKPMNSRWISGSEQCAECGGTQRGKGHYEKPMGARACAQHIPLKQPQRWCNEPAGGERAAFFLLRLPLWPKDTGGDFGVSGGRCTGVPPRRIQASITGTGWVEVMHVSRWRSSVFLLRRGGHRSVICLAFRFLLTESVPRGYVRVWA